MTSTSPLIDKTAALVFLALLTACVVLKAAMSLTVCALIFVWLASAVNIRSISDSIISNGMTAVVVGLSCLSIAGALNPYGLQGSAASASVYIGVLILCGLMGAPIVTRTKGYEFCLFILTLVISASCFLSVLTYQELKAASYGGLLKDANLAQAVLTATVLLFFGSNASMQKKKFIGAVLLLTVVQTQSKSASIALLLVCTTWLFCKKIRSPRIASIVAFCGIALAVMGVYALGIWALKNHPDLLGVSLTTRASLVISTLDMFKEHNFMQWIIGHGAGSWSMNYPEFKLSTDINSSGLYSHSDILDITYEYGILGLLGYIAILAVALSRLVRANTKDVFSKMVAPYLLVAGAFNFILASAVACLLLGIGLWNTLQKSEQKEQVLSDEKSGFAPKILATLVLISVCLCIIKFLPLQLYWAAEQSNKGTEFQQTVAWNALAKGKFYEPWHIIAAKRIQALDLKDLPEPAKSTVRSSLNDIDRAIALNPGCVDCRVLRTNLLLSLGLNEKAQEEAQRLQQKAPQSHAGLVAILTTNKQTNYLDTNEKRLLQLRCVQRSLSLEQAVHCAEF